MYDVFLCLMYICLAVLSVSVVAVIIFGGSFVMARLRNLFSSAQGDLVGHLGSVFVADARLTLAMMATCASFAGSLFFGIMAFLSS